MSSKRSIAKQKVQSGDLDIGGARNSENFDTMMDTPNALRFASGSFASDGSNDRKKRKGNKKGSKLKGPNQACCGTEGGGCAIF